MDVFDAKKHALKRVDCVFVILSAANKRSSISAPWDRNAKRLVHEDWPLYQVRALLVSLGGVA